ncbi:helix-turn-helix domain-containing protein [Actinomycetospora sp.]|uniref:TetR/AcrR family transcriptional regulator n=1 Tax=Actinomycetospora sp. TaxID=1872135 RepID=UPI002F41D361
MTGSGLSSRPLRADALRNHHAIVAAAREAFEQVGPDVPLEDVARRAGVGPSTLYRRFAGRDELVAAVFAEYFEEAVEPLLVGAATDHDPWAAVARVVEEIARALLHRRGILRAAKDTGAFTTEVALRFIGPLQDLVTRARAAGVLRDDAEARDLPAAAVMVVATAAPFGEDVRADRWARYLAFVLDALAAEPGRIPLPALEPPPRSEVADRLAGTCTPPHPSGTTPSGSTRSDPAES